MALWMVRGGRFGEQEDLALERGLAVIRWEEMPDLSAVQGFDAMKAACAEAYPEEPAHAIANYAGQLWAFRGRMRDGDLVALPLKTRSAVALGKVTGPYEYWPDDPSGTKHARPVEWIRNDVPRSDFRQDLLYSLGAFMTVCQITRNKAEERVRVMLNGDADPYLSKRLHPVAEDVGEPEEPSPDLERYALDQIRTFVGGNFKSHDLARLVTALLRAQGYQTFISPPGPDGGVDIVAGAGAMGFDRPRLCVQVKSGASPVDVGTLRELQGAMKNFGGEQGLLVSWTGFKEPVYREARTLFFEVRLWDADDLVQALLDHYEELPEEIQAELPLKRMWALVQEE